MADEGKSKRESVRALSPGLLDDACGALERPGKKLSD